MTLDSMTLLTRAYRNRIDEGWSDQPSCIVNITNIVVSYSESIQDCYNENDLKAFLREVKYANVSNFTFCFR